jgi:hypothetical protein
VKPLRGFLALSPVACLACGPSFQVIYEGNARFEHCYALEESPQTPGPEKVDCWRDWSERYTYGQTRDRINYATSRYVALAQSASLPTDEAMMMAAPGMTTRPSSITAPAPTNAFAPPPKVLEDYDASASAPLRARSGERPPPPARAEAGAPPPLPGAACSEGCQEKLRGCQAGCGDAGARTSACASCERAYPACMRSCFRAL